MKALMREVGESGQHQRWPPKVDRGLSVELQCGANQQLRGHVRLCAPFRLSAVKAQVTLVTGKRRSRSVLL